MGAAWSTLLSFLLLAGLQAISSAALFHLALATQVTLAGVGSISGNGRFRTPPPGGLPFGYNRLAGSQLAVVDYGWRADLWFGIVGFGGALATAAS